jgi:hypothetical protein
MRRYDASNAVDSAETWIAFLSWGAIIIGVILLIVGFIIKAEPIGLIPIAGGIIGLFAKALVKGFGAIVVASEIYIAEHSNKESKTSTEQ